MTHTILASPVVPCHNSPTRYAVRLGVCFVGDALHLAGSIRSVNCHQCSYMNLCSRSLAMEDSLKGQQAIHHIAGISHTIMIQQSSLKQMQPVSRTALLANIATSTLRLNPFAELDYISCHHVPAGAAVAHSMPPSGNNYSRYQCSTYRTLGTTLKQLQL